MIFVSKFLMLPSSNKPVMQYIRSAQINSKAPTVIFLHGFPENAYTWAHFLPHFFHLGMNVFAPNLRGNLLSNNFTSLISSNSLEYFFGTDIKII